MHLKEDSEERNAVVLENEKMKIFGILHQPKNKMKVPAVLICHGFAGNKSGKHRLYVLLAEKLAKLGIATLRIDFRGSGDSEGDFNQMTISSEVSDALCALNFLKTHPQIDFNRLGILGNSFGAVIATQVVTKESSIRSLVLLAGLFSNAPWKDDLDLYLEGKELNSFKIDAKLSIAQLPGKELLKEFYALDLSPYVKLTSHVPLLHIHSQKDERVSIEHQKMYRQSREETGAKTKWIELIHSDHSFSDNQERAAVINMTAEWFQETL